MTDKVTIAFCYHPAHAGEAEFFLSLLAVKDHDWLSGDQHLAHPSWLIAVPGTGIAEQRNRAVRTFLEDCESDWLLFIDTDEGFRGDFVSQMVASADPDERPILSSLIMAVRADTKGLPVSPACVGLMMLDGQPTPVEYTEIPNERHWHVGNAGAGGLMIHRTVLEAIGEKHKNSPWPWFEYLAWQHKDADGEMRPDVMGEDYGFSMKARALGFPIVVDTRIECSHIKKRTLTSRDFYGQFNPYDLQARTFAVIPTKGSDPDTTKRLLADLFEQGGYEELFVIDNGCTGEFREWLHAQDFATVIEISEVGIHHMWNAGAALAASRFPRFNLAVLNDDIIISDKFLPTLAEALHDDARCLAVCPNWNDSDAVTVTPLHGIAAAGNNPHGLCGWAFMVRSELFDAGYRWPTDCMWWFGDNDMTMTLDGMGAWYGMVPTVSVEHVDGGGKTGNWDDPEMRVQLAQDQANFVAKWAAAGVEVTVA